MKKAAKPSTEPETATNEARRLFNGRLFEPAPPYPGMAPGGLAEKALEGLRNTPAPRDYEAENEAKARHWSRF